MANTLSAPVCGLVFLLLLAPLTAAQEPGAPAARETPGPPPQERGRGENLMRRLNLTPEQRLNLRQIRSQSEADARLLARRVRLARRALDEAIYAESVDEALVEQRTRELSEAQAALVRLRAATEMKVRRVLTPEQLNSFRELRLEAQRRRIWQRQLRGARGRAIPGEPAQPLTDGAAPADKTGPLRQGPPRRGRRRP